MSHAITHTPAFAFLKETKKNEYNNEKSRVLEIVAAIERAATNPSPRIEETVTGGKKTLQVVIPFEPSDAVLCCLSAYYEEVLHWHSVAHTRIKGCNYILLTE